MTIIQLKILPTRPDFWLSSEVSTSRTGPVDRNRDGDNRSTDPVRQ
jgi:hypothetical protein